MAIVKDRLDLVLGEGRGVGGGRLDRDRGQPPVAGEGVLDGGRGSDHSVVLVLRTGAALWSEDADDRELRAVEGDDLADDGRAVPAREVLGHRRPHEGNPTVGVVVRVAEGQSRGDAVVVDQQVGRRRPGEGPHRVRRTGVRRHDAAGRDNRRHAEHIRRPRGVGQGPGVVHRELAGLGLRPRGRSAGSAAEQRGEVRPSAAAAAAGRRGGRDGQRVAAESADRGRDARARPGSHGDEDDHRRDADEDAEGRERRAELVRGDAFDREPGAFAEAHDPTITGIAAGCSAWGRAEGWRSSERISPSRTAMSR